jgi:hypothetical protein
MKQIKFTALALAIVLCISGTAAAYNTPDFTDVPPAHWAYVNIMEMADQGIIKGMGAGQFAPDANLKVSEFLALIGRSMYPSDCAPETAAWWETYYTAAINKGIVKAGEFVTADMERPITRNEMARILTRTDEKVNGNGPVQADKNTVADIDSIPDAYRSYATQAYAKGLLTGREGGIFDGDAVLKRSEASTVIKRLLDAANKASEPIGATGMTMTGDMITIKFGGHVEGSDFYGDSSYFSPAGVKMTMTTADGRELGTATTYTEETDDKGRRYTYVMETTIDKADFAYNQRIYYMTCTYIAPDGQRYSNISNHTGTGEGFTLYSTYLIAKTQYDFTGATINFSLSNRPSTFLDF